MSEQLVVTVAGVNTAEIPLQRQMMRIGSDPQCEARIDHPEVAPCAAVIDFRGGNYMVQNRNSFVVYVDNAPVDPDAWLALPPKSTLYLTRNVTLSVTGIVAGADGARRPAAKSKSGAVAAATEDDAEVAETSSAAKTWLQIGVIAVCGIGILLLLSKGESAVVETQDSFASLSAELAEKPKPTFEDNTLLRCLQEAWLADRRRGGDPGSTIRAYQILLSHPLVRAASSEGATLESRIKAFAIARLSSLQGRV